MNALRTFAFLLAAGLSSATSLAQSTQMDETGTVDISGSWTFETGKYNSACTIRGRMYIYPKGQDGMHACEFTTFEKCPDLSAEVKQSCSASVINGDQVVITSEIISIEDQSPFAYGYAPDNWSLTIRSSDEMTGTLESASRAQVIFERKSIPIS
ncbi:MAG: hypothetical protein CME88_07410 [Hirschia sp.]|nr:hypothetical protein [Hirschia sp.]MBF18188.1 hypothetical protein [Hirschia sp.]